MKYLLVMKQNGGCDYTIGCGIALEEIEVPRHGDIMSVAFEKLTADYGEPPDYISEDINSAFLYELKDEKITVPLAEFRQEAENKKREKQSTMAEKVDFQEYQRLKDKFEKGLG